MLRWSVGLIPWRAPMYSTASAWGINLQLLFNSPLITAILDFLQERLNGSDWHGWTYVSKGHNDGDGDGTEKHDHAQGKQDALVRRDIDLQQAKSKRIARRIHLTVTAFLFCCPKKCEAVMSSSPCSGSWRWWQRDTPELWCPGTATRTWCCKSCRRSKTHIFYKVILSLLFGKKNQCLKHIHLDTNPIMKEMLKVCEGKRKESHHWPRCISACCAILHTVKYSQREPAEWCSRETASCSGRTENHMFMNWY